MVIFDLWLSTNCKVDKYSPYRNLTVIYDDPKLECHTNPAAVLLPGHLRPNTDTLGTKAPQQRDEVCTCKCIVVFM